MKPLVLRTSLKDAQFACCSNAALLKSKEDSEGVADTPYPGASLLLKQEQSCQAEVVSAILQKAGSAHHCPARSVRPPPVGPTSHLVRMAVAQTAGFHKPDKKGFNCHSS